MSNLKSWFVTVGFTALVACGAEGGKDVGLGDGWTEDDFVPSGAIESPPGEAGSAEPMSFPQNGDLEGRSNSVAWFRWTKGDPLLTLKPTSTHVCGLAMVRGEFATNTSINVFRSGSNWVMRGTNPGSNTLQADALCEPLSVFRVNAGQTVSVGSEVVALTSRNKSATTLLPAGTAPIFTGISGHFEGGGERARITWAPSVEIKAGDQSGGFNARAVPLSFGFPAGLTPFLADEVDDDWHSWSVSVRSCSNILGCSSTIHATKFIAPLAQSFCYLGTVSGDFNGGDEWAQVFPDFNTGEWKLIANAGSTQGISARAECLWLDQRRISVIIH